MVGVVGVVGVLYVSAYFLSAAAGNCRMDDRDISDERPGRLPSLSVFLAISDYREELPIAV